MVNSCEWPSLGMPAKKSMGDTGNATQEIVVGKTSGPFHVQTLTNRLSTLKLVKDEGKPAVLVGRVQELEQNRVRINQAVARQEVRAAQDPGVPDDDDSEIPDDDNDVKQTD